VSVRSVDGLGDGLWDVHVRGDEDVGAGVAGSGDEGRLRSRAKAATNSFVACHSIGPLGGLCCHIDGTTLLPVMGPPRSRRAPGAGRTDVQVRRDKPATVRSGGREQTFE
jgi:hypothetical protein